MGEMYVYEATCCTKWTLVFGVQPHPCGLCGEVPVGDPRSLRVIEAPPTEGSKVVAHVARSTRDEEDSE